jgi:hypothetical protein
MNSAISYMSAAQMHADAIRDSYRDPKPRLPKREQAVRAQKPRPALALRALLLARV